MDISWLLELTDKSSAFLGAGISTLAGIGTGIGQGVAAGMATNAVSRNPEAEPKIWSLLIIGSAIAESAAIYGLIISIILIFVA